MSVAVAIMATATPMVMPGLLAAMAVTIAIADAVGMGCA